MLNISVHFSYTKISIEDFPKICKVLKRVIKGTKIPKGKKKQIRKTDTNNKEHKINKTACMKKQKQMRPQTQKPGASVVLLASAFLEVAHKSMVFL